MREPPAFTWTCAARTDVGAVRKVNEDALLERPDIGLWVVADGMGGHVGGRMASAMVIDALLDLPQPSSLSGFVDLVEERLLAVNADLRRIGDRSPDHTTGSTVAGLLALGRHAVCLWAGDSRVYRLRQGRLKRLTQDHAVVEDLVTQGMLSRDEAEHHPRANLITRAVGATDDLLLDMDIVELTAGDVFLLCTDGLTRELDEPTITRTLQEPAEQACDALIELALDHGARDNTTVVVLRIDTASPAAGAWIPPDTAGTIRPDQTR
jgi:protein phosphatase